MAKNWLEAQKNEESFWDGIYVEQKEDIASYKKINFESGVSFLLKTVSRHKIELSNLSYGTVVDLGCGPYGLVYGLAHLSNLGYMKSCKIIGVDPLIDRYKTYGTFPKCNDLTLLCAKGEHTSMKENSADYVFSTNVIDHVEKPSQVISEVRRVLKDGGTFCVSAHVLYQIFNPIAPFFKYIDKNHPHHFSLSTLVKLLKMHFSTVDLTYTATMIEDQPDFAIRKLFKSPSLLRGLKRSTSQYVIKNVYLNCK